MMKSKPAIADVVSSHLANDYETHNYAITLDEAKDQLRLTVEDLSTLTAWQDIQSEYQSASDGVQLKHKPFTQPAPMSPEKTKKQKEVKPKKKEGQ